MNRGRPSSSGPRETEASAARPDAGPPGTAALSRASLHQTLQSAQLRVAAVSMAAVALVLSLAAVLALRTYAGDYLELVARSIAYNVEAAVVFNDRATMQEQLATIVERESLRSATLTNQQGRVLAYHERSYEQAPMLAVVGEWLGLLLMPEPTVTTILDRDRPIGEVSLRGDGAVFARFVASAAGGIVLCLLLTGWGLRQTLRRMQRDIVEPMQALIAMTHEARQQRGGPPRAPSSRVREFHQLGEDFNALLSEIEAHQAQLAQENRSLSHLANHDSLTGLYNRAYFSRRLGRILQDAQSQNINLAVLYMDNDHFKEVNDRYGHAIGDLLLIEVAKRIRGQVREGDMVARLGGDEFAVLLMPLHQERDAVRIAEKINAAVAQPLSARHPQIVPSVSIGIALFPQHGRTADGLMRAADRAMYMAKKHQRGSSHLFEDRHAAADTTEI